MAKRLIALGLALALGLSGAPAVPQIDNLPRLGDAGGEDLSPGAERRIGDAIMRDLRRERAVLDDVELTEYLNRFASALTETAPAQGFSFEFFLVKDSMLNAFALPGGYIGVHTGLVTAAQSESELASVLSHEIGHVTQRHIARMLGQQRQTSVLMMAALVLAALAARSNPQAAVGAVSAGSSAQQQLMLGFTRDAEREADRVGLDILRQANFDPNGMTAFFGRLQQATRIYESAAPSYLRTHPLTTERIADLQARVRDTRYKQRVDSLDFNLAKAKLRALADVSVDGLKNARTFFERQLREKTASNEAVTWYGLAVTANAQRDFPGAERALGEFRKRLPAGHVFVDRLGAEVKLASGDAPGALALLDAAMARNSGARALVHLRAQVLIELRDGPKAIAFLQNQLQLYRSDPQLWNLLARAQVGMNQTAQAHRSTAEEYALLGGWPAAIEQLRLALLRKELDFYTSSQVDARLKELQAEYKRDQEDRAGK